MSDSTVKNAEASIRARNARGTVKVFVLAELIVGTIFILPGIICLICAGFFSSVLTGVIGCGIIILGVWLHLILIMYRFISYQIAMLKEISPTLINIHKLLVAIMGQSK